MTDVLLKVKHLMTLAVNSGAMIDEARNAALAAVQLIHKHNLLNGHREAPHPPRAAPPRPAPDPPKKEKRERAAKQEPAPKAKKVKFKTYSYAGSMPRNGELHTLKYKAMKYTDTIVNELREIYENSGFKKVQLDDIVKRAAREGEVHGKWEKKKFKSFLTGQFQRLRRMGILTGQRGQKGGYFYSGD